MKKILLTGILFTTISQTCNAYPAPDINVGTMPLQLIQQQNFQKMEINDYMRFKDAYDNPVEKRNDSAEQIQAEFEIKNLKKPAKIRLGQPKKESDMELIQDNGKIHIKHTGD